MSATVLVIDTAETLRDHLDALNDSGVDTRAVGIDAADQPFLIALAGIYADTEDVIYGSPWDSESDWTSGIRCEDCHASELFGIESLRFPVTVLVRASANDIPAAAAPVPAPATDGPPSAPTEEQR